jgi:hypothetical protein
MNRIIWWTSSIIGLIILLLIITCPSKEDYFEYLSKEYNISCLTAGDGSICQDNVKSIEWKSRHIQYAGIFIKVEDKYSVSNTLYEIRTIGVFNMFIDYSKITIND